MLEQRHACGDVDGAALEIEHHMQLRRLSVDAGAERDLLHCHLIDPQLDRLAAGQGEVAKAHAPVVQHEAVEADLPLTRRRLARRRSGGRRCDVRRAGRRAGLHRDLALWHQRHDVEIARGEAIERDARRVEGDVAHLDGFREQRPVAQLDREALEGDDRYLPRFRQLRAGGGWRRRRRIGLRGGCGWRRERGGRLGCAGGRLGRR